MKNNQPPTGYVPVILHLPEDLAERFQHLNYDWAALIRTLIFYNHPAEAADSLLSIYVDYTLLQPALDAQLKSSPDQHTHLCFLIELYRAILALEKKKWPVCVLQ